VPQSSQNADEGAFSAPHFGHFLDSGLPHAAQNFLLVVLSVPHLVQLPAISAIVATATAKIAERRSLQVRVAFAGGRDEASSTGRSARPR
jgi:hypothetical protein